ncbi:hypothetical protein H5V45_14400 [Nocardioides sp. KIGAM211]|uniref:Polysaccharide biosynthesis protein C-terminal domain-containing protein n=1 Tax=Nocardioides luti TaxID=2761101 RepID=A0A7X0VC09_9ACTN|nr:hypothetical protein [Nocardioides luti]MBB6628512.1 hypothetical protein [Nocardioides luti]
MIIGLVYQAILAGRFGLNSVADDFQYAYALVTFCTIVLFSLVTSVIIPRTKSSAGEIYAIRDGLLPLYAGFLLTVTMLVASFSIISGSAATILRWAAASGVLAGATVMPQAVAYMERRFVLAAMGPVANGVGGTIALICIPSADLSPASLGLVITLGYVAQLLVSLLGLAGSGARWSWMPSIQGFAFVSYLGFTVMTKFQPVLERAIAQYIGVIGTTAALGFGQKFAQGLLLVSAFGLALTAAPAMSALARKNETAAVASILSTVVAGTYVATILVLTVAVPLSYVGIKILFERDAFSAGSTREVYSVVMAQLVWVFANAMAGVGTSYLYVIGQYARVLLSACAGLAATVGVSYALDGYTPLAVAWGSSAGALASLAMTTALVMRSDAGTLMLERLRDLRVALAMPTALFAGVAASYVVVSHMYGAASWQAPALPLSLMVAGIVLGARSARLKSDLKALYRAKF